MKKINSNRAPEMHRDYSERRRSAWLMIIIVLALALSACGTTSTPTPLPTIVLDSSNSTADPVSPVSSSSRDVVASAILVPAQEADLAFVTGGNVSKVNVKVGDRITAGYILVELDNTILQLEVDRAQRALRELTSPTAIAAAEQIVANAQEAYDEAKKKSDSLGRRFADNVTTDYLEAQVTLAQNTLDLAQDAVNKTSKLSSADPARAKATTNLYNAQRAYNTALANLNWFTEKPSENEVAIITANFNVTDAALQEAKWYLAELKGETIPAEATGAQLAQLQQARDNLKSAQDRLEQTRLIAPISGVVAQVDVIAGEYAAPGKVLIVLSDVDQLQVKTTDLSERDVMKVKVGDPAVILIDALEQEFNGTVLNISPLATILGGDVVYEITLAFDEQPGGALAGMTADVTIGE